jgi:uncharacterized protein YbjT (DUF2867 family)
MSHDSNPLPILVIGATGRHGGTGTAVVRMLREQGLPVRALVRVDDDRAKALREMGAETVAGDLHDRRSLSDAVKSVSAAYFTYPVKPGIVEAAADFAAAARAAQVPRLVVMSMPVVHPEHPSPFAREHWLAEEIFQWAGLKALSVRIGGFFFENLKLLHGEDISGDGVIRNSFGDVPVAWIAGEDAGKIAVAALLHPERFGGIQGVAYVAGAEVLKHSDIARILGANLDRRLRHETITKEAWAGRLIALSARDQRINELMARHISEMGVALSRPGRTPREFLAFETMTGQKPLSLAAAIDRGALSFATTTS